MERKIGEVFETADGRLAMCVKSDANICEKCIFRRDYDGCMNIQVRGSCSPRKRCDGNSVIFVEVDDTNALLERDIDTLERLIKVYPCKTMENVLVQLKSRLKEK